MTTDKTVPLEDFETDKKDPPQPEAAPADAAAVAAEGAVEAEATEGNDLTAIHRVPVVVRCVIGSTKLPVSQVLQFNRGSVVELDKRIGDPVDILVNDRLVARGDLVVVEENRLGVTLTEIVKDPNLTD